MKISKLFLTLTVFVFILFYAACKDKSSDPQPGNDKCASKSIVLTATLTPSSACQTNGRIVVRATGSTGFTFQLNSGSFQADSVFDNLAAGNYTITAKDIDGCAKSSSFTVADNSVKGAKFTAVEMIITTKCRGTFCHGTGSGGAPTNIMKTSCEIVNLGPTIKVKAIDEGMGSLNTTDKNKITAWLAAGGKLTD